MGDRVTNRLIITTKIITAQRHRNAKETVERLPVKLKLLLMKKVATIDILTMQIQLQLQILVVLIEIVEDVTFSTMKE